MTPKAPARELLITPSLIWWAIARYNSTCTYPWDKTPKPHQAHHTPNSRAHDSFFSRTSFLLSSFKSMWMEKASSSHPKTTRQRLRKHSQHFHLERKLTVPPFTQIPYATRQTSECPVLVWKWCAMGPQHCFLLLLWNQLESLTPGFAFWEAWLFSLTQVYMNIRNWTSSCMFRP